MKGKIRMLAAGVLLAGALTLFTRVGIFRTWDLAASDWLYQKGRTQDGEIVLIGIDQQALEAIGPYSQWGRDVMARILETLNQSEDCRPAVIGVDVLYTGQTQEEADQWLAEAAGQYGNVVTASLIHYKDGMEEEADGEYGLADQMVIDEPYPLLKDATLQGHIKTALDADGILRHHFLKFSLPDGTEIPSLALAVAQEYRKFSGEEPVALPPVNSGGFWYLPFCGYPGDMWESNSVATLLAEDDEKKDWLVQNCRDRIVLIGPYAVGLQDSYITSIDHTNPMYGVEYQANAIQALLWENYKKEVSRYIQMVLMFTLMLLCLAGFWRRPVKSTTLLWLAVSGGYLLLCRLAYHFGWVLHVLWIPVGATVLYVFCLAFNYIQAAVERRKVTNTFKRYVAPEIVNEILKGGTEALELGGKMTRIAVLFVDVRGFTPMSEMLSPAQVVEILNQYLALISRCILKNGGTLDKFIGDAAMAFWGAPLPQEDFVMKAVQAAADMAEGSRPLAEELMKKYGRTVSFGIGVHVGEAVVGNVGAPERMDYTAIGDTVNTAARLEANAPAGTVYISRAVADELEGRIRTRSLGDTIKLKGKKEGFEVLVMEEIL